MVTMGVDLVEVERIAHGVSLLKEAFLARAFTPLELDQTDRDIRLLAQIFACKEAVSKALGVGIAEAGGTLSLRDMEIRGIDSNRPTVLLSGEAEVVALSSGVGSWHVGVASTCDVAVAVVVGEKRHSGEQRLAMENL